MSNLSEEKPKTDTPKPVETPKPTPKSTPEPKHEAIEGLGTAVSGGPKFPKPPEKPAKRAYHKHKKVKKDRPYYHELLGIED